MSIAEKFEVIADEVYEKGKKDEYDRFWDKQQMEGNRTNYNYMFYYWADENVYPKYDIKPVKQAANMFLGCYIKGSLIQRFLDCNMNLDTSKATSINGCFQACYSLTHAPALDLTSITTNSTIQNYFYNCSHLVEASLINVSKTFKFNTLFTACSSLEKLIIEGVIGQNGFNVSPCKKLTKESLLSILQALSLDITETKTITFSTEHQSIIETDTDCKPYWEAAKNAGWSFVYE